MIRAVPLRLASWLVSSAIVVLLLGCAAPRSYMGISLEPGAAPAELQALAYRAQSGEKQAQLDLGIAFEEGTLVPVNIRSARKLYSRAASNTGRKSGYISRQSATPRDALSQLIASRILQD